MRAALPAQIQKGNGNPPPPRALVTLTGLTVTGGTDTGNGWTVSIPGPGAEVEVVAAVEFDNCRSPVVAFSGGGTTGSVPGGAGTAPYRFRCYRPGTVTVSAVPSAIDENDRPVSGYPGQLSVTVSLVTAVPSVTITGPAPGATVEEVASAGTVQVTAVTPDVGTFGSYLVTARPDIGMPVPLALVAGSTTEWAGTVVLPGLPLGRRTVTVTAACAAAPDLVSSPATVALDAVDVGPPQVAVTLPQPSGSLIATPAMTVQVQGTASDSLSGMRGQRVHVAVALSPDGARTAAVPAFRIGPIADFSTWSAVVPVPGYGSFTLYAWATDAAGNTTPAPLEVPFEAISSYVPGSLDERLSDSEYLAALMQFARDEVTPGAADAITSAELAAVLGQPADRMIVLGPAHPATAQLPVNELRVPAEILQAHIAAHAIDTGPGAGLAAGYLLAAYQALLSGAGTSYAELRLARGADQDTVRKPLAARLGITLSGASSSAPRPDQLDALTLDGPALTEAALEDVFGLRATTAGLDPLRTVATGQLVGWQVATQRLRWQAEDAAPPAPVAYSVLVDPDVITAGDVLPAGPNAPLTGQVLALLSARADQLAAQASALRAVVAAGAASAAALLSALLAFGVPGTDIAGLAAAELTGADISGQLDQAGLDRTGFGYLVQLLGLADAGIVEAAEWATAVDVLTGAYRRRQYPTWAGAEAGVVLSPDVFGVAAGAAGPAVSADRIDPRVRAGWAATLAVRVLERQSLADGAAGMVATAEQATLRLLRDALLYDVAAAAAGAAGAAGANPPGQPDIAAAAARLADRYQVDFTAGGAQPTTRLAQATASLQALLMLVRSGDNASDPTSPASGWTIADEQAFDGAWNWMGTAGGWQSATTAFLFPEAVLDPFLLLQSPEGAAPTPAFADLCQALAVNSAPDLTAAGPVAAYQAAATALLRNHRVLTAGDTLSYLSPGGRSKDHQQQLATWSGTLSRDPDLGVPPDPGLAREVFWGVPMLVGQRLHAAGQYQAALDWLWIVLPYNMPAARSSYDLINTELGVAAWPPPDLRFPSGWTAKLSPFDLVAPGGRPYAYTRNALLAIIGCLADYADGEFATYTAESVAHARALYATAGRLLGHRVFTPVAPATPGEPALPVPQWQTLRSRVAVQQAKLSQDRDIAGQPQAQVVSTGNPVSQPTPYHFKVLLARAQQLAQQATTLEAEYLSALEKYDAKQLQLSDAQNAANVARQQLTVHADQVQAASDAVTAATAQQAKATTMAALYGDYISAPPNQYEQALLGDYQDMRTAQDVIAGVDAAVGIAQSASQGSSSPWGALFGALAGTAVYGTKAAVQIWANNLQAQQQADQLQASIEDRKQDWQIQQAAANQDALVAAAQVQTATDQVTVALAEQAVATMASQQAQATLTLLANQFTGPDLYKWMSEVLGGVYRYFLQQATATARLAQAQLAFERAEQPQTFIRLDYWQPPAQLAAPAALGDTRGMTGAEQLGQDLDQLDQYAFSTDTRLLNLSQTFSLSQLLPVEFLGFRATGQLSFATPMAWFDQDFPGHYQRLIRQVSVGVVALVPPARGIRATLSSSGISQVIAAGNGTFSQVTLRRDPQVIAFTSPAGATGVFTTDLQPDMLLPFEGSGVATSWDLSLPPAANPFSFASISDVLVTIDYTALTDPGYQAQVIRGLNANLTRGADCVFSVSRDFPDQWYALANPPAGAAAGQPVTLTLTGQNFPAGILPASLATFGVAVQLSAAGASGPGSGPLAPLSVTLAPVSVTLAHAGASGVAVTDATGVASTRRGAAGWNALTGTSPAGDWTLSFDATGAAAFQQGLVGDLVLIISWTGQAPPWPA